MASKLDDICTCLNFYVHTVNNSSLNFKVRPDPGMQNLLLINVLKEWHLIYKTIIHTPCRCYCTCRLFSKSNILLSSFCVTFITFSNFSACMDMQIKHTSSSTQLYIDSSKIIIYWISSVTLVYFYNLTICDPICKILK